VARTSSTLRAPRRLGGARTPAPMATFALLRRLRVELPLVSAVAAVVLVTSLVFAAMPRAFESTSEAGLRADVAAAAVDERGLVATTGARLDPGSGGLQAVVDARGAAVQRAFPASVRSVIEHRASVVDSVRYLFPDEPFKHLALRYQDGLDRHVRVLAGRLPAPTAATVAAGGGAAPVLEVAMSPPTAQALDLALGQTAMLGPDPADRLIPTRGGPPAPLGFRVVGLIQPRDPGGDYWYGDGRLQTPSISDNPSMPAVYGTAMFAAAAYPQLLRDTAPALLQYSWRYLVSPSRFQADQADQLAADLGRLQATHSSLSSTVTDLSIATGLPDVLTGFAGQRRLTESLLSLPVVGLLAISLAVLGLLAAFAADRRREGVALARSRGASAAQLLGAQALEGALLCLPAALAGALLALSLVRGETSETSLWLALGIAAAATLLLLATALPWMRRKLGGFEREEMGRRRLSPRRVALEAFAVALAGAGVYLLRQRGLGGEGSTSAPLDPYLAAAPALLALATGLVVVRLAALPLGLLAWRTAGRADLVPFMGARRASRQPAVAAVPLLALVLAIAVGVFASTMVRTIEAGQVASSWQRVGADHRVDPPSGGTLDPALDLSRVRGVAATAGAYRADLGSVALLAVQPSAYQRVTAGTPADPHLPPALLARHAGRGTGGRSDPIPAIVSRPSPTGAALQPGDTFSLQPAEQELTFVVSQVRDRFAGLPAGRPFVVASLGALAAAEPSDPPAPTRLYLRASAGARGAIQRAIDEQGGGAVLTSRADVYAAVHDAPLVAGAVGGFRAGLVAAGVYAALAVIVALALTGRARGQELGHLRVLGLSRRQVTGLMAVQQVPPAVLALVVGAGLGAAIVLLIAPGVDFAPFTGPDAPAGLQVDWPAVALLAGGLLAVVVAVVGVAGLGARRLDLAGVLRWEER
jgi:putative ABC transport system permease protein